MGSTDFEQIAFITTKTISIIPFRDSKRVRLQNKKQFQDLAPIASKSCTYTTTKTYRCLNFLSPTKLLCAINDRISKRAYFGIYILNTEKGWRESTPRILPYRIRGVTSMDVSINKKMIGVASSDMGINIFHMDNFSVPPFLLPLLLPDVGW